jgi:hypothetical protein
MGTLKSGFVPKTEQLLFLGRFLRERRSPCTNLIEESVQELEQGKLGLGKLTC